MAVPVLVTSLDPGNDFSEVCETLVVSSHGCAFRSPMQVKAGVPVHFHSKEGRQTMGHIVDCQPLGSDPQSWKLGAQLDEPDNFWGLNPCPEDWVRPREKPAEEGPQVVPPSGEPARRQQQAARPRTAPEPLPQHTSDDRLRTMILQLLQPLQAELAQLQEKLAQRGENRSRFEVSLSQIPPQLEEQLWVRLRQDVGQQSLQLARQESDRVLGAAHAAIERNIAKAQSELQQRLAKQLESVEQRTQTLAQGAAETVQDHFRAGLEQFQRHIVDAEAYLTSHNEALVRALQERLDRDHQAQIQEMQQVRESMAAESVHLQSRVDDIAGRLEKLDEAARRLESDFEARLSALANDIASRARAQIEHAVHELLKDLSTRGAQELARQLEDSCTRLQRMQGEIEASMSESLQIRVAQTTESFEQNMDDLAEHSVARWRGALARDLNSLAKQLGHALSFDAGSDGAEQ